VTEQLRHRRGARVGWKLGMGDRERIGDGPVVGHLTGATQLGPGGSFVADGVAALHADAEVALEIGADGQIAGYGAALELVDLGPVPGGAEAIVASNVFHRAFALGPSGPWPSEGVAGRLLVNGSERAAAPAVAGYTELVRSVAALLDAIGERLEPGDRIITGSVVQVPVAPGDDVVADLGSLGRVGLSIAR
jgi:2-keto-4-pentenoate hydratase